GDDLLVVMAEDGRAGDELRAVRGKRSLFLQRLAIEQDDGPGLRDHDGSIRYEGERADEIVLRLPRHDRLGVAVEIDPPDTVRRARAVAGGGRVERRVDRDRIGPSRVGGEELRGP